MDISVITLFPDLYKPFLDESLMGRAQEKGIFTAHITNLFSLCEPRKRVDAPSFGPGAGMLLKPELIQKAIEQNELQHGKAYKIFFSPHGTPLNQYHVRRLANVFQERKHVMLLPARYEGMDARVEEYYADEIISIGDYVLMGGDIPAMVLLEGVLRYIPGVVGKDESVACDSFSGPLVDYPEYTEPVDWQGMQVPEIIRSGNHKKIEEWREKQALNRTVFHHFDWVRSFALDTRLKTAVHKTMPPHYVALMHDQVMLKDKRMGTSSVTSLDVHDIARSAATYGLKKYFVVTPLKDQQKIVQTLLDFWDTEGKKYNIHRHEAVQRVQLEQTFDDVIQKIEQETGKKPIVIATSAQKHEGISTITYCDQALVWKEDRPVLLLLGTAFGLSDGLIKRCDYVLEPLEGFTEFNHLSVRSAAAIIFDRWMGINIKRH